MPDVPTTKPERADKARNRARILQAASAAFAESGLDTQMDDIAGRAGVGVGTVYRHFATKEALMAAMVQRKFALILDVVRDCLTRDGEPFEMFADSLREGSAVTADDAAAQHCLMGADADLWQHAAALVAELQAATQVLIDRAQAAGTLRGDLTAGDIPVLMGGISATMAAGWDWRRHLEIVIDGLRAR